MMHNGIVKPHIGCSVLSKKQTSALPIPRCGVLSKQSPSRLPCPSSRERFVKLQDGVLYWSACASSTPMGSADPADCKGCVSFCENPFCEVMEDPNSGTRFMLTPAQGQWRRGNFTGARSGRVFVFDVNTDFPSRADWLLAFRNHIAYGNRQSLGTIKPRQQGRGNGEPARLVGGLQNPQDTAKAARPVWGTRAVRQFHQADQNADPALATPTLVADQKLDALVTLSEMNKNTIDVMRQHGFSVERIVEAYGPAKQQQVRDYLQANVCIDEDQERVSTCQP